MAFLSLLVERWSRPVDVSSLWMVRICVGALIFIEMARFYLHDWALTALVTPKFHFTYAGFGWVQPLGEMGMNSVLFGVSLAALGMVFGFWYRWCAFICAVGVTYIFLIDKTHYLNHMYFLIWVCLLFSILRADRQSWGHQWMIDLARFQVGVVYVFGGIAKLNPDWFSGRPMLQWMDQRRAWPVVGEFLAWDPVALAISWGGVVFDLFIVPALLWSKTRRLAFVSLVVFHLLNAGLFKIGIFPWMMIAVSTVFFEAGWCRRHEIPHPPKAYFWKGWVVICIVWGLIHVGVPLRHHMFEGDVAWTEQGHRFSWRMKLRSKVGRVVFHALDVKNGTHKVIDPMVELTTTQTRKMATRPDMVLQYAHHLHGRLVGEGSGKWAIHVDSQASLNGRPMQPLVRPSVDLSKIHESAAASLWITNRP